MFTHDSIVLGEDGPTHQPVEQLASLRAIPGLVVIRPADANETRRRLAGGDRAHGRPTALVLTRQKLPTLDRAEYAPADGVRRGGYVLDASAGGQPDAHADRHRLRGRAASLAGPSCWRRRGVRGRLVSMPSWELFAAQPAELPRRACCRAAVAARLAVEAASPLGWERFVGLAATSSAIDRFGASAPGATVLEEYGFTVDHVVDAGASRWSVEGQEGRDQDLSRASRG